MSKDVHNDAIMQIQQLYKAVAIPEAVLHQMKLAEMFASDDYKIFMKDCKKCLEGWQYFSAGTLSFRASF